MARKKQAQPPQNKPTVLAAPKALLNEEQRIDKVLSGYPEHIAKGIKDKMKRRAQSGVTSDRVFDSFFSPFRTRSSVEQPTKRKDLNEWYRFYFKHHPTVGTALELHTEFPLSGFHLEHEDKQVEQFFNDIKDDLNLEQFVLKAGLEWWVVGEFFPFAFVDDVNDPTRFDQLILLDPDYVKINTHQFVRGEKPFVISLKPDADLKKIVNNGANSKETGDLYTSLPADIIDAVKNSKDIMLPQVQVSHVKRGQNPFNVRGESVIARVIHTLMYEAKLKDAQYTVADRHVSPHEFYMIGEPGDPADQAEIENFRALLDITHTNPNQAIIWHHALRIQWEGANGRILPLQAEFDQIQRDLLNGLGISEAFLNGTGPTYANASVALDVLIGRYIVFRETMERWIQQAIFAPICKMHKIYKRTDAELEHRFHIKDNREKCDLPKVIWTKTNLRDDNQKIALYERLVEKNFIPAEMLLKLVNINPNVAKQGLKREREEKEKNPLKSLGLPTAPAAPEPEMPLPADLPSLPEGVVDIPMAEGQGLPGQPALEEGPLTTGDETPSGPAGVPEAGRGVELPQG